jgi:hypothetical protein
LSYLFGQGHALTGLVLSRIHRHKKTNTIEEGEDEEEEWGG